MSAHILPPASPCIEACPSPTGWPGPGADYRAFAIRAYAVRLVALSFTNLPAKSFSPPAPLA